METAQQKSYNLLQITSLPSDQASIKRVDTTRSEATPSILAARATLNNPDQATTVWPATPEAGPFYYAKDMKNKNHVTEFYPKQSQLKARHSNKR